MLPKLPQLHANFVGKYNTMGLLEGLFGSRTNGAAAEAVQNGAVIVDVRSPQEFASGHVAGSKNVPLQVLDARAHELKKHSGNLVLCCASGNRSGMAVRALEKQGIQAVNGGGWMAVQQMKNA